MTVVFRVSNSFFQKLQASKILQDQRLAFHSFNTRKWFSFKLSNMYLIIGYFLEEFRKPFIFSDWDIWSETHFISKESNFEYWWKLFLLNILFLAIYTIYDFNVIWTICRGWSFGKSEKDQWDPQKCKINIIWWKNITKTMF